MKSFVTFGMYESSIDEALKRLQSVFGGKWTLHESSFRGSYYMFGNRDKEYFELQPNYLTSQDEWMLESYKNCPLLLYVNATLRPNEVERLLHCEFPRAILINQIEAE